MANWARYSFLRFLSGSAMDTTLPSDPYHQPGSFQPYSPRGLRTITFPGDLRVKIRI